MKRKILYLTVVFFLFSFIGTLLEFIYKTIFSKPIFYDISIYLLSGLKIPLIPVYGIGAVFMVLIGNVLDEGKNGIILRGVINGVVLTILELWSGFLSLIVFGNNVWDYSDQILNFNGIISLQMFTTWIIAGYIFTFIYVFFRGNKKLKKFVEII